MNITIPALKRGRLTAEGQKQKQKALELFASQILAINGTLPFKVSSRGWCYVMEKHGLMKGAFSKAEDLINDCRKSGLLPIDITERDVSRSTFNIQQVDFAAIDQEIDWRKENLLKECDDYSPISFWDDQDYYIEVFVEKIDLRSLFLPVCEEYYIPITNVKGWCDIHTRADVMKRFQAQERLGKQCILLYCGDHDPFGLIISETLMKNFADLSKAVGWSPDNLIIDRFGLNSDFIEANNITWIDNLETSSGKDLASPKHKNHYDVNVQNYLKRFGARKAEGNALVVRVEQGQQLMRGAINKYIDHQSLVEYEKNRAVSVNELKSLINDKWP